MEPISEVAARWAVRAASGTLTPEEERELTAWLDADPRHRGAYVRARAQWVDLDRLAALHGPSAAVEQSSDEPLPLSRRYWLTAAAVAAITVLGGALSWMALKEQRETYATAIGEVRRIPLGDGSTLVLNTNTEVQVQLAEHRRDVYLQRGEALFEVAHDKSRPFIVRAKETAVRAVGTAFAVRMEASQIDVTVTEGVVEISDAKAVDAQLEAIPAARPRVSANQRAVIVQTGAPAIAPIPAPQVSRQLAWREGMVSFDGESLATAVNEINRHNRRQIVIGDADLAQRPLVGVFRATDVEGFAAAAATTLKARAVIADDTIRIEL